LAQAILARAVLRPSQGLQMEVSPIGSPSQQSTSRSGQFALFRTGSDGLDPLARSMRGSGPLEWHPPLPPVRFPLRDALTSFQDNAAPPSPRSAAAAAAAAAESKGPLVAKATEKSRALKQIGRRRRQGVGWTGDEPLQRTPRAPPECDRPRPPPKVVQAFVREGGDVKPVAPLANRVRQAALRGAEEGGGSLWPVLEESKSAPSLSGGSGPSGRATAETAEPGARDTWTSAARAVLAHSRRFGGPSRSGSRGAEAGEAHGAEDPATWFGPSPRSCRGLPQPVRDWAARGLEFTDSGLGIGPRFEQELRELSRRSPGPIYEQQTFGSVSRWSSDSILPTKQPCTRHFSAEAHKMGVRRDVQKKGERQKPGPGTYEIRGFADDLLNKLHPKGSPIAAAGIHAGLSPSRSDKGMSAAHF